MKAEAIKNCNLCQSESFSTLLTRPASEWDPVRKFFGTLPETFTLVQCDDCGLVFVNPRLPRATVLEFYDRYHAGEFDHDMQPYDSKYRGEVFQQYVDVILSRHKTARSALDIGCADGVMLAQLKGHGLQASGIELSKSAAAKAAKHGKIYQGDALSAIGKISDQYDIITLVHSLEHVGQPLELLIECHRKLNNGGLVFIDTPDVASGNDRMSRHFYLFSQKTLEMALEKSGFSEIEFLKLNQTFNRDDITWADRFLQVIARKGN